MLINKKTKTAAIIFAILILAVALFYLAPYLNKNWGASATVIIMVAILIYLIRFERNGFFAKEIAIISSLSAFAALSRIPFVVIPNVQPSTFIVIMAGYVFGPQTGFLVGVFTTLVSNIFLGHGPWTPWQMLAWGLAGVSAGLLAKIMPRLGRIGLSIFCGLWGLIFGLILNFYQWTAFVYPLNLSSYILTCINSIPFDLMHAFGNIVFAWVFSDFFLKVLNKFKKKMEISYITEILPEEKVE